MTNPTPEQVEAAAKAMRERSTWPSMHWPDIHGVDHIDTSRALAIAALVAAAGVTPQEPGVTEEELNKLISPVLFNSMNYPEPHRMLGKDFSKLRGALVRALIEGLTESDPQG